MLPRPSEGRCLGEVSRRRLVGQAFQSWCVPRLTGLCPHGGEGGEEEKGAFLPLPPLQPWSGGAH